MDNMQQNPASSPSSPAGAPMGNMETGGEKSMGPLIGSIIIVVILIAGGFYLWNKEMTEDEMAGEDNMMMDDSGTTMMEGDVKTKALETQNTSDETSAIEADLNATDLNNMDAELQTM